MNILFVTRYPITDQKGGIERISDIIIGALPEQYKVFSAYINESPHKKTPVEASICINNDPISLYEFAKQHKIDIIINQQCQEWDHFISLIKERLDNLKTIYFQHDKTIEPYKPLKESFKCALSADLPTKSKLVYFSKWALFPIYFHLKKFRDKLLFRKIYNNNDKLLILTDRYLPDILKTIGISSDDQHRIGVVNNCLTIANPSVTPILSRPRKVLIVSRMTEERKRILLAIKIWDMLQAKYPELNIWQLELVGSGEYLSFYRRYVKKHAVPNIIFAGQVSNIENHYASSQIFMMTSYAEGWGLTVTEAQQYGVIPVAFDSYEAINDLISSGYNGVLVDEGNIMEYVDSLADLMSSNEKRATLSSNAYKSCSKFSVEKITNQWINTFKDVSSIK